MLKLSDGKQRHRAVSGYFTLEAAFLVPMAFFLFAFIIHMAFMLYGRSLLVPDAYLPALRASMLKEDEDVTGFAASNAAWQFGEKYFGNVVPEVTAGKEGKYIVVRVKSHTNRSAFDLAPRALWEIGAGARAIHVDVPKRIRKIDRIADIAVLALRGKGGTPAPGGD